MGFYMHNIFGRVVMISFLPIIYIWGWVGVFYCIKSRRIGLGLARVFIHTYTLEKKKRIVRIAGLKDAGELETRRFRFQSFDS